jgi:hypothetical protein
MTVTCSGCGLSFETAARTNTRCKRCRKVVNVERQHRHTSGHETDPLESGSGALDGYGPSPYLIGLGVGAAAAVALWHGLTMKPRPGTDPTLFRRSRFRWCVAGAVLVTLGGVIVSRGA